jgi:thiazole synthase
VGAASDAAYAMELGCDGVLMNTAIAGAKDPALMAEAMRDGRAAFLAGRMPQRLYPTASSPEGGSSGAEPAQLDARDAAARLWRRARWGTASPC